MTGWRLFQSGHLKHRLEKGSLQGFSADRRLGTCLCQAPARHCRSLGASSRCGHCCCPRAVQSSCALSSCHSTRRASAIPPFSSRGLASPFAEVIHFNDVPSRVSFQGGFFSHIRMPANAFGIGQMAWRAQGPCLNTFPKPRKHALDALADYTGFPPKLKLQACTRLSQQGRRSHSCSVVLLQAGSDIVVSFKRAKDREQSHGSGSVTDISGKPVADAAWFPRNHAFTSLQP